MHDLPEDLLAELIIQPLALALWQDITLLVRNEWNCWVVSAKQATTRAKRVACPIESLGEGKTLSVLLARVPAPRKSGAQRLGENPVQEDAAIISFPPIADLQPVMPSGGFRPKSGRSIF